MRQQLSNENDRFESARREMTTLLRSRGINDSRVLSALAAVPRHVFVPGEPAMDPQVAYGDHPLPIGWGQTISQPYVVAYMTQRLDVRPEHRVLEVGSGCGYQAAILAELGGSVSAIERLGALVSHALTILRRLGYSRIRLINGDGYRFVGEGDDYDRIIVSCAPPEVPPHLVALLAERGRLIVPVGGDQQRLCVIDRRGREVIRQFDLPVRFVPMVPSIQSNANPAEKGVFHEKTECT